MPISLPSFVRRPTPREGARAIRFAVWGLVAALPALATADAIVVVPGKNAGYIYSGSSASATASAEDTRISLAVFKLGGFNEYRIESTPAGFVCDTNCSERADKVKGGPIALKIVGNKPVPGLSIPLKGIWQAPCQNTTTETDICELNLSALNAQVRVTVTSTVEVGTEVPLPEGGTGLYITHGAGELKVAGHARYNAGGISWLSVDQRKDASLGLSSTTDGPGNTAKLAAAGSAAALYCSGLGSGWYLPARTELDSLTSSARAKISGYSDSWSSTEKSFTAKPTSSEPEWEYSAYVRGTDKTAYKYKLKKTGVVDKSETGTASVLCFRKVAL